MGQPQTGRDERPIRLVLSVGKPHESSQWHIIMGTPFLGIIIIFAIWNGWSSAPGAATALHTSELSRLPCYSRIFTHRSAFFCLSDNQPGFSFFFFC